MIININYIKFEDYENNYEFMFEDKETYFIFVRALTEKNYNLYKSLINPKNLKRGWKNNHIDHIYSISQGFKDKVNPFIIAHPVNLRMLKAKENKKKRAKCDISLEELLEKWNQF